KNSNRRNFQLWSRGLCCFKFVKTPRANAYVCAFGSAVGIPCLFLGIHLILVNMTLAWVFIFFTIIAICLNWSINVEILLDVVTPQRRSVANSWEILISHLLGDASGPYIVGLVSDSIRGTNSSPASHFGALVKAFYIPNVILVISAVLYIVAAAYFVSDHERFKKEMGFVDRTGSTTSNDNELQVRTANGKDNQAFA
ncbi:unnamed protein product, partial [Anisakis simplex]|uniref:MFS domain-containing protein n=1 Tax=Anisakis simplex TaxID=6269 RepID=A0A0M3K7X0_ANISI